MKKIFLYFIGFSIAFTSCLKDQTGGKNLNDATTSTKVFEVAPQPDPNSGIVNDRVKNLSFTSSTTPDKVEIPIYLASADGSTFNQDVTITLQRDLTAIADYNSANGTTFVFAPNAAIVEPANLTVTLAKGSLVAMFTVMVNTSLLNPTAQNALAYKIVSVPSTAIISNTRASATYLLAIKNQFDGVYTLNGRFYHPSLSPNDDRYTTTVEMRTTGPNTVKIFMTSPAFGFAHPILNNGAITAFASQEPEYTVNAVTNAVTVQNAFAGAVTFYGAVAGANNVFIPSPTKTIYAKFGYNLGAGGAFQPGISRQFTDTLIYLRAR